MLLQPVADADQALRGAPQTDGKAAQTILVDPAALGALRAQLEAARAEAARLQLQVASAPTSRREELTRLQELAVVRAASLEAQLDQLSQGPVRLVATTAQPPLPANALPPDVLDLAKWGLATLATTILAIVIIQAVSRWFDRKARAQPVPPDVGDRLARVEQAVESIAIEVERIGEGQRFSNTILAELRALPAPSPDQWKPSERVVQRVPNDK